MRKPEESNGWWEWKKFLIAAVERLDKRQDTLDNRLTMLLIGGVFALLTAVVTMGLYIAGD